MEGCEATAKFSDATDGLAAVMDSVFTVTSTSLSLSPCTIAPGLLVEINCRSSILILTSW